MLPAPRRADRDDEIELYRRRVAALYELVSKAVIEAEPSASVRRGPVVHLDEQLTGPYSVETLEVAIPGMPEIRLIPRGIYFIGARGSVDARSTLGRQHLVWVESEDDVPDTSAYNGDADIEIATRPVFPNVPEGWAWADERGVRLMPLTDRVFLDHVLPELAA